MGEQNIKYELEGETLREFTRRLFNDLRALEIMIAEGMIEKGVRRIGAEQEMFLIDAGCRPSPIALQILDMVKNPHFTTELALFNLEINLDPLVFGGDCLNRMESDLLANLADARRGAEACGGDILLAGILPTIRKSDLELRNLTPLPRYKALNHILSGLRGGDYEFYIRGLDELNVKHDSVLVEACNASFQVHLQVGAEEFAKMYNIAQALTGPVLAAATNSPLLFGRRLWHETRIAVFRQAIDTRLSSHFLRERSTRVTFGSDWVEKSVTELYREDISRFRPLIGAVLDEDALDLVRKGITPNLKALKLQNGTVYRWNRACYGISDGKPHLRIENRVFPSGPSPADEIANAAFWLGLMRGCENRFEDITEHITFEAAKMNFYSAARYGLFSQMNWLGGIRLPAQKLICDELLPLAEAGLRLAGIDEKDVHRYLGIVDDRVRVGQTGSDWMLTSFKSLRNRGSSGERLNALTAAIRARQKENLPVSQWKPAELKEAGGGTHNFHKVEQFMTTDLFTVQEDESVELVANLMDWKKIRHVPVEDKQGDLVGLISYRSILHLYAEGKRAGESPAVFEIMKKDPLTVPPETTTLDAVRLMRKNGVSCLPVTLGKRLVGIVTERDLMKVTAELLEALLEN